MDLKIYIYDLNYHGALVILQRKHVNAKLLMELFIVDRLGTATNPIYG